jgi:hypothetical protein
MFKSIFSILLVLVFLSVGICCYAKWQAHRARKDAEILISDIYTLQVMESTLADINRIAAHHGGFLVRHTPACKDDGKEEVCYFDFYYENSSLTRLRLASVVRFGVRVQVQQRRVGGIIMDLTCGVGTSAAGIYLNEGLPSFADRTLEITRSSNIPGIIWLLLTPNAPERGHAYSLSLKCIDHIGKCPDGGELLPAAFSGSAAH